MAFEGLEIAQGLAETLRDTPFGHFVRGLFGQDLFDAQVGGGVDNNAGDSGTVETADAEAATTLAELKRIEQLTQELEEELKLRHLSVGSIENWNYLVDKYDAIDSKLSELSKALEAAGLNSAIVDRYDEALQRWFHSINDPGSGPDTIDRDILNQYFKDKYNELDIICKNIDDLRQAIDREVDIIKRFV